MTKWLEVTEARYDEMLGVLPPEIMTALGFLVGEPSDHVICKVTKRVAPNFQPFAQIGKKFYEATECMTIPEFKAVTSETVLANVEEKVA
jgi:hypothetical protein